jgi:3-hydroxyisobutyrate dehydrogenase-like beta-hydroxyacid dehydrogenase
MRIGVFAGAVPAAAVSIGRALADAGVVPCVHAVSREAVSGLVDAGARWHATPAALAASCDLMVAALSLPADVGALIDGPHGLGAVSRPRPGSGLLLDMGTLGPREVQTLAARLEAAGIHLLDAATVGAGALRVGGDAAAFERAGPLLSLLGSDVRHVGAVGSGRVVGCCHRIVEALTIEAVAEALTLARRLGADPARVRAALAGGFAASHVLEVHGARMLSRDFAPGQDAGECADALGVVVDEAHALGLDLPGSALVAQQLNALVGAGDARLDASALVRVLERMAGEAR